MLIIQKHVGREGGWDEGLETKVPYSGKLLREKTFANFAVWGLSVKNFSTKSDGHTHS